MSGQATSMRVNGGRRSREEYQLSGVGETTGYSRKRVGAAGVSRRFVYDMHTRLITITIT